MLGPIRRSSARRLPRPLPLRAVTHALQVSERAWYEWYFDEDGKARVGRIFVRRRGSESFEALDEGAEYQVITGDYIASGNDGFEMFAEQPRATLGVAQWEAVAAYLQQNAAQPPGSSHGC